MNHPWLPVDAQEALAKMEQDKGNPRADVMAKMKERIKQTANTSIQVEEPVAPNAISAEQYAAIMAWSNQAIHAMQTLQGDAQEVGEHLKWLPEEVAPVRECLRKSLVKAQANLRALSDLVLGKLEEAAFPRVPLAVALRAGIDSQQACIDRQRGVISRLRARLKEQVIAEIDAIEDAAPVARDEEKA